MYFRYFVIIFPWKRAGPFICTNLNPLHPRMPCAFSSGELKIHQFYTFYPKMKFLWGGGHEIYNFLVSLPYRCYIPNLVKIGPVVLEEKMLTQDARRTRDDDGCQHIAIGHLCYSGDLMIYFWELNYRQMDTWASAQVS